MTLMQRFAGTLTRAVFALLCFAFLALPAQAAEIYPSHPIKWIVPYPPAGTTDILARVVGQALSEELGQQFIIENRPGAGNTIGMAAVAHAEPDGYTILANSSTHTVSPATRSKLTFNVLTDLPGVIPLGNMPVVMAVNPKKGYKTLADFVNYARKNPGVVNYASAGAGNSSHLNAERFRIAAKFEAVHVPQRGAPEALTEVIAGRLDFYFAPLLNAVTFLREGTLQALAVSGSQRASALPDVPTTIEAGYPNSEYNFWAGVFVPAKTPPAIRERLHAEIVKALKSPVLSERLGKLGADPFLLTPAQFDQLIKQEVEVNTQLVKAAGIEVN
jgi:tripartite-type tricarboxylate transporter receptor subunit TctC